MNSGLSKKQGTLTRWPNVAKDKKSTVLEKDSLQDLKDTLVFINSNILSNDNQFSSIKQSPVVRTISSAASSSTADKNFDTSVIRSKYDGGSASQVLKYPTLEGGRDLPPKSATKSRTSPDVEKICICCDRTLTRLRTYDPQAGINKKRAGIVEEGKDFSSKFSSDNGPPHSTNMFENAMPFNISGHTPGVYESPTRKLLSNSITKSNKLSEARYGQEWSRNISTSVIPKTLLTSVSVREDSNLEQRSGNPNFTTLTEIPTGPSVVSEEPVLIQDNLGTSTENVHINSTEYLIPEDCLCKRCSFFRFLCCIC